MKRILTFVAIAVLSTCMCMPALAKGPKGGGGPHGDNGNHYGWYKGAAPIPMATYRPYYYGYQPYYQNYYGYNPRAFGTPWYGSYVPYTPYGGYYGGPVVSWYSY